MTDSSRRRARLVLLDAGGVLLLPDPDVIAKTLSLAGLRIDPGRVTRAHYVAVAAVDAAGDEPTLGTIAEAFVPAFVAELLPTRSDREPASPVISDLFTGPATRLWTHVAPGTRHGLRLLEAIGVDLAVVSNSDGSVAELLQRAGLCQVGEGPGVPVRSVVDSSVAGVEKPDPAIFRIAMEAAGLDDDGGAVHVGDSIRADVDGARAAGVTPLHFDPLDLCPATDHLHVTSLADVAAWVAAAP